MQPLQDNKKKQWGSYNERLHVYYRKEITLYDSLKLLTPVGIQISKSLKQTTKKKYPKE